MATSLEPLKGGYDVDENAVRFSNYFHVLRELVHLSCGWLPLEPRLEVKYVLGDHLHDDARAVTKIKRRLYELRTPERLPRRARRGARRAAGPRQRRDHVRRVRRDRLRGAQARRSSPPSASTSTRSTRSSTSPRCGCSPRSCTARSATSSSCRPRAPRASPFEDLGALPIRLREVRELQVMPPLDEPARDDYVEVTEEGDTYLTDDLYVNGDENHVPTDPEEQKHFFHGLMDAELCAAELMARNSHEHPEMPWDFHVDMARQCWDEIRHAEVHDRLMATELGLPLGRLPDRLRLLQVDLPPRPAEPARAVQRHERAEGDVAPLAPPQGARRARPDDGRARVRLPARGRGPARPQRRALGLAPARRRREGLPREGARAARRARRAPGSRSA